MKHIVEVNEMVLLPPCLLAPLRGRGWLGGFVRSTAAVRSTTAILNLIEFWAGKLGGITPDLSDEIAKIIDAELALENGSWGRWRIGQKVPINVYDLDRPVCQCHTVEDARRIVMAVNSARTGTE